ncbi:MAG: DUF1211 domain-containing protein [Thermoplasmata archaeon]|nr:DUF1211 domain-containing protein [Thermoplasmata archaeon]
MAGGDERDGSFQAAHHRSQSGEDLSRIISLSDGIFAFAMTLLVIQLTVPSAICADLKPGSAACSAALGGALNQEHMLFYGYFLTFLIIGIWWMNHAQIFRAIGRFDAGLIWWNLLFLLTIAIQPFVLGVYQAYGGTRVAVILFALVESASGLLLAAIWQHAERNHLLAERVDRDVQRYLSYRSWLMPVCFLASVPVAFLDTDVAQYMWIGAFVVVALLRKYGAR